MAARCGEPNTSGPNVVLPVDVVPEPWKVYLPAPTRLPGAIQPGGTYGVRELYKKSNLFMTAVLL